MTDVVTRPARDDDAQDLFGLLALCFAEYPGCFVDPHDDLADLHRPAHAYAERGGRFWVVEDARGRACACAAIDCPEPGTAEMHRLYVRPDRRRGGLGRALVDLIEQEARAARATLLMLWSDTRFSAAHQLYDRLDYVRTGLTRDLGDISRSTEHRFEKRL